MRAPFLHQGTHTRQPMIAVLVALIPWGASVAFFGGWWALSLLFWALILGVLLDYIFSYFLFSNHAQAMRACQDGSGAVSALLLALMLPFDVPFWALALGIAFSLGIAKAAYGGLGQNLFNPALAGFVFVSLISPDVIAHYPLDSISGATALQSPFPWDLQNPAILWRALAIIAGALWLLFRRVLDVRLGLGFLIGAGAMFLFLGETTILWEHLVVGSFLPAIVFYITDPVSAPSSSLARWAYAISAGALAAILRLESSMSDGTAYAILIANFTAPLWDRLLFVPPWGRRG